jgi:hypothetical protein
MAGKRSPEVFETLKSLFDLSRLVGDQGQHALADRIAAHIDVLAESNGFTVDEVAFGP